MNPRLLLAATMLSFAALNAHPAPQPPLQPPLQPGTALQGTALEVIDVGSYTYVRIRTAEGEVWSAVARTAVAKGSEVQVVVDAVMEDFESPTLKRKFDRIVFGSIIDPKAAATGNPHAKAIAPAARVAKVAKASGADAKTVEEIVTGRAALKDKAVSVRGQVVKLTAGVMGKNWIHLQDGSGSAATGTHDILVTTTTEALAVGDVVDVRGTVRTDVTVGPGYSYGVLVEGVKVAKS